MKAVLIGSLILFSVNLFAGNDKTYLRAAKNSIEQVANGCNKREEALFAWLVRGKYVECVNKKVDASLILLKRLGLEQEAAYSFIESIKDCAVTDWISGDYPTYKSSCVKNLVNSAVDSLL